MFQTLYSYPRVVARHREGPFAQAREQFLNHYACRGAAPATLLRLARELLVIAQRLDLQGNRVIPLAEIEAGADRWIAYQRRHRRIRSAGGSRQLFVQTASAWLRFLGRLEAPPEKSDAFAGLVQAFDRYLREERGLSPHTIHDYCWHVRAFLHWLGEQGGELATVRLEDIDAFLAYKHEQGWCRVSIANVAHALRRFFRCAGAQGWCNATIAAGIEGPRLFRHESLPLGPTWEEVQHLIARTDTDRAQDIRDRAIFLLLAVYALRAGEVVALTLDAVNWEQEIIRITRPKQRCQQDYPLVTDVGEAIVRYLQQVRPRIASRALFVTIKSPFHALSASSLHHLVCTRMNALGIRCPRPGPHALRHACAAHLVAEGFSLKQLGDHLGHRSAYATRTYAKVDLVGLRQVADVTLGDLL